MWTLVVVVACAVVTVSTTSSQNLLNFRRHPHYSEGHRHSLQLPSKKVYEWPRAPFEKSVPSGGPWVRVPTKDKVNGYSAKSTLAFLGDIETKGLLEVREANEHFVRMRSNAQCKLPRPQVVCVRDLYPEKDLLPKCTLLHRCHQGSGCCEEGTACKPRSMQEVALHFYVLDDDHKSNDVEKLLFVNHTECECQAATNSVESMTTDQRPQGDQVNPKCRACPDPFCVRSLEGGRCSCDCFDKHKPCIRVKRGREALEDEQRRCVLAGECNVPDCDYGSFDPEKGRCPRRPSDQDVVPTGHRRPHPNSRNPGHRWAYFERD